MQFLALVNRRFENGDRKSENYLFFTHLALFFSLTILEQWPYYSHPTKHTVVDGQLQYADLN